MKIDGLGGEPEPFAPRLDQQRDQLPLRAAGVLELVDEHVVIARLEPEAALRELVHLPQQLERALEHVGEVEDRALVERPPVLRQRDREHPPDAAREHDVEVARERPDDALDVRRDLRRPRRDAASQRVRRRIVRRACRDGSRRLRAALPSCVRKCARDAVEQRADLRVAGAPSHVLQPLELAAASS